MAANVDVLRWLHILCMVYWLAGEWGVFQSSRHVINSTITLEERRRHFETAYRIDILARTGIILLLPLGLHMGFIYGLSPFGGGWLVGMWIFFMAWVALCWAAYFTRETDRGVRLTKIDESIRYFVIPALFISVITSLMGKGPFEAYEGARWYVAKIFLYTCALVIGLALRYIMRDWTMKFRKLALNPDPEIEAQLLRSRKNRRPMIFLYWIIIAGTGYLGAVKPF